jgi:Mrp family chromosome partitioning ATPase
MGTGRNVGTTLSAIALARLLAAEGRVVLIDLALDSPNLSVIAADPAAPGVAELAQGSASFGQVITRDRFSGIHLITAGQSLGDPQAAFSSQRLSIALEALARCYDFVVVDAGALPDLPAERIARLAPRAVLVAEHSEGAVTADARLHLLASGFAESSVLAASDVITETSKTRAAA